jgi:putative pyruvate formate lyase activating enzyme
MKRDLRFVVSRGGDLQVEDPSPLEVSVLRQLGLAVDENREEGSLVANVIPRYRALVRRRFGLSGLDVRRRLLRLHLRQCRLCGFACGGSRADCPASRPARVHQHYVHVGEEAEIGRTLVLELAGCNLHCRFCQKGDSALANRGRRTRLGPSLWRGLLAYPKGSFASISFLGGNPDQSLGGVLDFLAGAPPGGPAWPVVWHTNGYSMPALYRLLNGLVDVWVFDFKFFAETCSCRLSRAADYAAVAKRALGAIAAQDPSVPIIVRHLMLPGHEACCQVPLVEYLARRHPGRLLIHLMDQYVPAWQVRPDERDLLKRVSPAQVERMRRLARERGLRLVVQAD